MKTKEAGICNSFSYAYKLLLDKLRIPCMLVGSNVEEETVEDLKIKGVDTSRLRQNESGVYCIPHMLVLVQNNDGTFSFDDITYAILNRGTNREQNYFNYDYVMAKQNRQIDLEGIDTYMLRYIVKDSKDTEYDELYRKEFTKEGEEGFFNIPIHLVKRYEEKQPETKSSIDYERE